MPREPHLWDPVCPAPAGLVRPVGLSPADPAGPTRGQARSGRWRRTSWGRYVPADVDSSRPEQRILEQSLRAPAGGAVTGWAGCRLFGARFFDGLEADGRTPRPVPIVTGGPYMRGDHRVQVLRDLITPDEVTARHGIPCAVVLRSLFDAMRTHDLREAVVDVDMMAAAERVSIRRMRRYVDAHPGYHGVTRVRAALELASESSRSPNETRTRLIWLLDAELPPVRVNVPVFDLRDRLLGIADLLDEEAGVAGEFDGADHRRASRHTSDVGREDRFRRVGLEVFRVTGLDLAHPDRVVHRMRGARRRARWDPPERRSWTTRPPPWWEPARSLDAVLDERDALNQMHEALARQGLL